jgi:hypothetical protein
MAGGASAVYAAGDGGLLVLDTADPARPVVVGRYAPPGLVAYDLAVQDAYAYLAAGASGLRVVAVADPRAPREVGAYAFNRAWLPLVLQRAGA